MAKAAKTVQNTIQTVLVGGGTGFIGSALCKALRSTGYQVIVISRSPKPFCMSWNDLKAYGLPEHTTAVVNCAGQNVFDRTKSWTEGFKQDVYASRVMTTESLAKAIEQADVKPKVFITMSGVGYYAPSTTVEYTEYSPGGNFDFFSTMTRDWEKKAQLPSSCKDVRVVNIRSGVVLGRQGGIIKEMYFPFFFGLGGPVGLGRQYFPWIHVSDIVGLILFSIEKENVTGILNGVAPQIVTNRQFASAFGRAMFRPAFIPLPVAALNYFFSPERAKIMTEGQKVIPKRTLEYGFTYDYPDIKSACKACSDLITVLEEKL